MLKVYGSVLLVLAFFGLIAGSFAHGLWIESHPIVSYRWKVVVKDEERLAFNRDLVLRHRPHIHQEGDSVQVSWHIGPSIFDREEHVFPAEYQVNVTRHGYYKKPGVVYREGHRLLPAE